MTICDKPSAYPMIKKTRVIRYLEVSNGEIRMFAFIYSNFERLNL